MILASILVFNNSNGTNISISNIKNKSVDEEIKNIDENMSQLKIVSDHITSNMEMLKKEKMKLNAEDEKKIQAILNSVDQNIQQIEKMQDKQLLKSLQDELSMLHQIMENMHEVITKEDHTVMVAKINKGVAKIHNILQDMNLETNRINQK